MKRPKRWVFAAVVLHGFGCGGESGNRQPEPDTSTDSAKAGSTTSEQVQASELPPALHATCDSAAVIAREALNIDLSRKDGRFADSFQGTPRLGCRMTGRGSFAMLGKASGPVEAVDTAFKLRGWRSDLRFMADGPDGSDVGLRLRDMLCLVGGRWSGEEEKDGYELMVECARDASSNPLSTFAETPKGDRIAERIHRRDAVLPLRAGGTPQQIG